MKSKIRVLFLLIILIALLPTLYNKFYNPKPLDSVVTDNVSNEIRNESSKVISENITSDMSEYDKVKAIHDYIILTTEFDIENLNNNSISDESYSAKGALINHLAVCQGYAEAFKLIMTELGIGCHIITGYADNELHAWNIVRIDNEWYQVDVTWDDPVPDKNSEETSQLVYTYFLLTDEVMYQDHTPDNKPQICTSEKYMYAEKKQGVPYFILDSAYSISNYYLNSYLQGDKTVTFYFPELPNEALMLIFDTTGKRLVAVGEQVTNVVYTPVVRQGKYSYTTISFE